MSVIDLIRPGFRHIDSNPMNYQKRRRMHNSFGHPDNDDDDDDDDDDEVGEP